MFEGFADLVITLPGMHISVPVVKCSCLLCILLSGMFAAYVESYTSCLFMVTCCLSSNI